MAGGGRAHAGCGGAARGGGHPRRQHPPGQPPAAPQAAPEDGPRRRPRAHGGGALARRPSRGRVPGGARQAAPHPLEHRRLQPLSTFPYDLELSSSLLHCRHQRATAALAIDGDGDDHPNCAP